MFGPRIASLSLSRSVLSVLIRLNWIYGLLILGLLITSHVATDFFIVGMGISDQNSRVMMPAMRTIMALGILSVPLTYVVLSRLLAIVETVQTGDPFISENARRLQGIAWAILGMEFTHVVVGLAARGIPRLDIDSSLSITRWLAVLLLFVLARVFEQGARMREEIEGTI